MRKYSVRELCACGNEARYTTVITQGTVRTCGVCSVGKISVRDSDVGDLLYFLNVLLNTLEDDGPRHPGSATSQVLRSMIGRVPRIGPGLR